MSTTAATPQLGIYSQALLLRAERQRLIASNMANADTPGYAAREINFGDAMREATSGSSLPPLAVTHARHQALPGSGGMVAQVGYEVATQPSLDGNSVDMDRERAAFAVSGGPVTRRSIASYSPVQGNTAASGYTRSNATPLAVWIQTWPGAKVGALILRPPVRGTRRTRGSPAPRR